MSTKYKLSSTDATQITDGTDNAHVTVSAGIVLYADSEDSTDWHLADRVLNISSPLTIWMKSGTSTGAEIVVTTFSD